MNMIEGLTVMTVNGDRYLLNMDSPFAAQETADRILKQYPQDACVDFAHAEYSDFNNDYPR